LQNENKVNTTACPAEEKMLESEIERLMKGSLSNNLISDFVF